MFHEGPYVRSQRGPASGRAIAFTKRFSNRDGLGELVSRTVREGDLMRTYVRAVSPARKAAVDVTTTYVNTRTGQTVPPTTSATQSTTTVTVNTVPGNGEQKPVANPERTKVPKTQARAKQNGKRRDYSAVHASWLEKARQLAEGTHPTARNVLTFSGLTVKPTTTAAELKEKQNRQAHHARRMNELAQQAGVPVRFFSRRSATSVTVWGRRLNG